MKKIVFILLFFTEFTFAQNGMHKYFISFTDKANSTYSINSPEEYLSSKTIARHNKFFIDFESTDLPVNKWYADSIINLGFQNASNFVIAQDNFILFSNIYKNNTKKYIHSPKLYMNENKEPNNYNLTICSSKIVPDSLEIKQNSVYIYNIISKKLVEY